MHRSLIYLYKLFMAHFVSSSTLLLCLFPFTLPPSGRLFRFPPSLCDSLSRTSPPPSFGQLKLLQFLCSFSLHPSFRSVSRQTKQLSGTLFPWRRFPPPPLPVRTTGTGPLCLPGGARSRLRFLRAWSRRRRRRRRRPSWGSAIRGVTAQTPTTPRPRAPTTPMGTPISLKLRACHQLATRGYPSRCLFKGLRTCL